jgi:predicted O-methyltransferase YrrM
MNSLALKILTRGTVEDSDGQFLELHSNTSLEQARFLVDQIEHLKASTTIEIGLAFGISALCICDAIRERSHAQHHVIDPFQLSESWRGIGLKNIERAGLQEFCTFYAEPAQTCLARLAAQGLRIDFAYIDAGKRMDDILIFTYFIGQMLRVGGRIAYDDVCFPGIRKALRYLSQEPQFRVAAVFQPAADTLKRQAVHQLANLIPGADLLFAPELLQTDQELGISGRCVVLEKVAEECGDWQWHPDF